MFKKKILSGTLGAIALALTLGLAFPQPANAYVVCRDGWNGNYCYRVHHVRYVPYHRWHHHGYYYGHYYR